MKKELTFEIEQEDGAFVACHEPEMATQGDTLEELVAMIRDLVKCRFGEGDEHLAGPSACTLSVTRCSSMPPREIATRPFWR